MILKVLYGITIVIALFVLFTMYDYAKAADAFISDYFVPCVTEYDTETFSSCKRVSTWHEDGSLTVCRWYTFKQLIDDRMPIKVVCTITGQKDA